MAARALCFSLCLTTVTTAAVGRAGLSRARPLGRSVRTGGRPAVSAADTPSDEEEEDPRVYAVELSRRSGIDFGCDLSLRWPYVFALVPGGSAELSGAVVVGDQLIGVGRTSVMGITIAEATQEMVESEDDNLLLTFFRGSRPELQQAVGFEGGPTTVAIRVVQKGQPDFSFTVKAGSNLRDVLTERKINVYRSVTRWTNCDGKQLCGTCIVNVNEGGENCSRKSIDEASTLRENPQTYRLACITYVYGDVTVEVQSPVGQAQWTR